MLVELQKTPIKPLSFDKLILDDFIFENCKLDNVTFYNEITQAYIPIKNYDTFLKIITD